MSHFLLVHVPADNNGEAKLLFPHFPFHQFSQNLKNRMSLPQSSSCPPACRLSGGRLAHTGWRWIKSSEWRMLLHSYRRKKKKTVVVLWPAKVIDRFEFGSSTCCAISVKQNGSNRVTLICWAFVFIANKRAASSGSQQGFSAGCTCVALLLMPVDLWSGTKWKC